MVAGTQALAHEWFTGVPSIPPGVELDLEGSFRGIKLFVVARKLQTVVVFLIGVCLSEPKASKLVSVFIFKG